MTLKDAALAYYDRGWCPIPLRSDGDASNRKKPAIDRWRQYQYIRPERERIEEWWDQFPAANIAILCGKVSGLVVVDFDAGEDHGIDPVAFAAGNGLEDCGIVSTGKGWHFYFRHPGGHIANGVRVGRLGGVPMDVRADGGYVVAPPSVHGSGHVYTWLQDPGELPVLPDGVRRAIDASPDADRVREAVTPTEFLRASAEFDQLLAGAAEGSRNHAAARVSGYLLKVTKGDRAASWSMLKIWNQQNRPPLPEGELHTVFGHIERAAAESALDELVEAQDDEHLLFGKAWADAVVDVPPRKGVPAPSLPGLEEMGGLVPKDLLILAGRPGMGKSTCAWGIVYDAALRQRLPTVVFSTEMTAVDVARWMACRMHSTSLELLTRDQWLETLALISRSPITICDRGSVTADYIMRVVDHRPETKLVIIDHIQRVGVGKAGEGNRNRDLELMAGSFKNLAKDNDCTVLVLSQMSRLGAREGRPNLTHLRDSGGLEQEADGVFFIWSEAEDPTINPLPVHFYLAKNRHGALREIDAQFFKHLHKFVATDLRHKIAQHQAEAVATQTLNNLMRGDDGREPEPIDAAAIERDANEDAALRLLD